MWPRAAPQSGSTTGRRAARIIAAGLSLLLGCAVGLPLLHALGYGVQLPLIEWRFPLYRRDEAWLRRHAEEQAARTAPRVDLTWTWDGAAPPPERLLPFSRYPRPEVVAALVPGYWYPNPELGWLNPPGMPFPRFPAEQNRMAPGKRPWEQVANNYGFADEDFHLEKPPGELRLGVFGGSAMQNGSNNACTVPARLQAALHKRGHPHVRVLNFAYTAWVATQELACYAQIAVEFDLDAVLVVSGANDLVAPLWVADPRPGFRLGTTQREAQAAQLSEEELRRRIREQVSAGSKAWRRELVETYLTTLRRFRRLVPREQPFLVAPQPLVTHQRATTLSEYEGWNEDDKHILACYELLFARLAELLEQEGLTVLDLRRCMQGHDEVTYWDAVHCDDVGNQVLGEALARLVEPLLPVR